MFTRHPNLFTLMVRMAVLSFLFCTAIGLLTALFVCVFGVR